MNLRNYVSDHKLDVLIQVFFYIILSLILRSLGLNVYAVIYILCIGILCNIAIFVHNYGRSYKFYQQINHYMTTLDQKYMMSELLEEPDFQGGKIFHQCLKSCNKDMNDKINEYKAEAEAYREYIEMWIHEVKTPVAAAKLMMENHSSQIPEGMEKELQTIEYYLDQALYYARSTGVEKDYMVKKLQLKDLVEKVIKNNARMLITSKITIDLQNVSYIVYTDEKWVTFILNQILINAVKYRKKEAKIKFYAVEQAEQIILKINDNGIGISKKDLPKVTEKGYTGTSGRKYEKSTGMGLYLCKSLSEKLGINFWIESKENIGTTVNIGFPRNSMTFLKES